MADNINNNGAQQDPLEPPTGPVVKHHTADHRLNSNLRGESEVEELAKRIETRRDERIVITLDVRVALIEGCRKIAEDKKYTKVSRIDIADLIEFRDETKRLHAAQENSPICKIRRFLGFRNQAEQLGVVFDRAVKLVQEEQSEIDDWFHYMDFNMYYTELESPWPWMRNGATVACMWLIIFYFSTPILFCSILKDAGVCPQDVGGRAYSGWMSALYFASTTLSTVGYGDLSVTKDETYKVFFGMAYMIYANVILVVAFSSVAEMGLSPLGHFHERLVMAVVGKPSNDEALYEKIRRLRILRLTEIVLSFSLLNLIGVFANRLFLIGETEELRGEWNWMISFYWAVQTTTTIGYGDLVQPFNQRWFQIFYLILSTYFVGNTLGGLASLRSELEQVRRNTAWGRREVNKGLIDEMQPEDNDGKIDQYEFLVASLLHLGKISSSDVEPIMDKFRELASGQGFIIAAQARAQDPTEQEMEQTVRNEAKHSKIVNVLLHKVSTANVATTS